MKKILAILALLLPVAASAQRELFMQEFNEVNDWFFNQPEIVLVQKYIYYSDSLMAYPTDSSVCTITKANTAIHYKVTDMESFSDSGYAVKVSHTAKYMVVSKTAKTDTAQLRAIFNEGFSGFSSFTKSRPGKNVSAWEMGGGTAGVNAARLEMDLKGHKIISLEMFLSADHPLISPYRKPGQETGTVAIIKIEYQYHGPAKTDAPEQLSDFITVNDGRITPSAIYKGYQLKNLTEKQ